MHKQRTFLPRNMFSEYAINHKVSRKLSDANGIQIECWSSIRIRNWIYLGIRSNGIGQALLVAFGAFKTRVFHIQEYWVRKNLYLTIICIKILILNSFNKQWKKWIRHLIYFVCFRNVSILYVEIIIIIGI